MTTILALIALSAKQQITIPGFGIATPFNIPSKLSFFSAEDGFSYRYIHIANSGSCAFYAIKKNEREGLWLDALWMWQPDGSRETEAKVRHFYKKATKRASVSWLVDGEFPPSGDVGLAIGSQLVSLEDPSTAFLWLEGMTSTGFWASTLSWVKMSEKGPVDGRVVFYAKEKMEFVFVNVKEKYLGVVTPPYSPNGRLRVFSFKNKHQNAKEVPAPRSIKSLAKFSNFARPQVRRKISPVFKWLVGSNFEMNIQTGKKLLIPESRSNKRDYFYVGEELFYQQDAVEGSPNELWKWNRSTRKPIKIGDWSYCSASNNGRYVLVSRSEPKQTGRQPREQLWIVDRGSQKIGGKSQY